MRCALRKIQKQLVRSSKFAFVKSLLHVPVVTLHPNGVGLLGENRVKYAEYSS
jgi:ABC-type Co2+ transport system permease subunit